MHVYGVAHSGWNVNQQREQIQGIDASESLPPEVSLIEPLSLLSSPGVVVREDVSGKNEEERDTQLPIRSEQVKAGIRGKTGIGASKKVIHHNADRREEAERGQRSNSRLPLHGQDNSRQWRLFERHFHVLANKSRRLPGIIRCCRAHAGLPSRPGRYGWREILARSISTFRENLSDPEPQLKSPNIGVPIEDVLQVVALSLETQIGR